MRWQGFRVLFSLLLKFNNSSFFAFLLDANDKSSAYLCVFMCVYINTLLPPPLHTFFVNQSCKYLFGFLKIYENDVAYAACLHNWYVRMFIHIYFITSNLHWLTAATVGGIRVNKMQTITHLYTKNINNEINARQNEFEKLTKTLIQTKKLHILKFVKKNSKELKIVNTPAQIHINVSLIKIYLLKFLPLFYVFLFTFPLYCCC